MLAYYGFPAEHRRQTWSTNSLERLNKEVGRRCDVVGIFPNRQALLRLVGAVLEEQNDEWAVGRRDFSSECMASSRNRVNPSVRIQRTRDTSRSPARARSRSLPRSSVPPIASVWRSTM